jgi:hypothetical protein
VAVSDGVTDLESPSEAVSVGDGCALTERLDDAVSVDTVAVCDSEAMEPVSVRPPDAVAVVV